MKTIILLLSCIAMNLFAKTSILNLEDLKKGGLPFIKHEDIQDKMIFKGEMVTIKYTFLAMPKFTRLPKLNNDQQALGDSATATFIQSQLKRFKPDQLTINWAKKQRAFLALDKEAYKKQLQKKHAAEFAEFNKIKQVELKKLRIELEPIFIRVKKKHESKLKKLKIKYEEEVADAKSTYEKSLIEFKEANPTASDQELKAFEQEAKKDLKFDLDFALEDYNDYIESEKERFSEPLLYDDTWYKKVVLIEKIENELRALKRFHKKYTETQLKEFNEKKIALKDKVWREATGMDLYNSYIIW